MGEAVKFSKELEDLHLGSVDNFKGYLIRVWKKHIKVIPGLKFEVDKVEEENHLFSYFKVSIIANETLLKANLQNIRRDIEIAILVSELKPVLTEDSEVNFVL
jgi:hypothetical protein